MPYQFFVRHAFSEGNRAAETIADGETPRVYHHFLNLMDQLIPRSAEVRSRETLNAVLTNPLDGRDPIDRRPAYTYGTPQDANVVSRQACRRKFDEHNVSFVDQQAALLECGPIAHAWTVAKGAPWRVSRLVRTWETALLFKSDLKVPHATLALDTQLDETFGNLTNRLGMVGRLAHVGARIDQLPPENRPALHLSHAVEKFRAFAQREGLSDELASTELMIADGDGTPQNVLQMDPADITDARFPVWRAWREAACEPPPSSDRDGELFFTHSKCIEAISAGVIHPKNSMVVVRDVARPSAFVSARQCKTLVAR